MYKALFIATALLVAPVAVQAQGIVGGAEQGSREGAREAGPVGGVVGGVLGGVAGGVSGLLGLDQGPRFREYVVREKRPSYNYNGDLIVGSELPSGGVTYYDVPPEYGAQNYRYTVVNGRTVLVEPGTRRIVEIVE